jgi:hypothetical protein
MDFDDAINEHRELQRRNARLEPALPLERYRAQVTSTHPLPFNQQAEAPSEETQDLSLGRLASPIADHDTDSSRLWDIPALFE